MANPEKRLLLFVVGVLAVFATLEIGIRARSELFSAASHRTLAKVALLREHGPVEALFVGSSRTQDGVSPTLLSAELGGRLPGFNVASTATSLETLEWLAEQVADRPGLRVAVIEVSGPQLTLAPPQFLIPEKTPEDLEGQLALGVRKRFALVAQRGVLFSDNLTRLPALLLFGPALDGSEVMAGEQLSAWLGQREEKAAPFDVSAWKLRQTPEVVNATSLPVDRLAAISDRFRRAGVRVIFQVPPLARSYSDAPERAAPMQALLAQLQARTHAEIWDWSAADVGDENFRGNSHLNHLGRARFARALAREFVRAGLAGGAP